MPIRRVSPAGTSQNLAAPNNHQQHLQPTSASLKPSPSLPSFTRSASPSSISNIFTRPARWFQRSNSGSRPSQPESRPSTSSITSTQRKPTISGPTDPRPIQQPQDVPQGPVGGAAGGFAALNNRASRSVLDLSRASTDLNTATESVSGGLGDLRLISRRAWSRSADNLNAAPPPNLPPLNTSALEHKIEQYRAGSPATPVSAHKIYPFPSVSPSTPPPVDSHLHHLRHAHSHSGSTSHMITPVAPSPSARLIPPSPQQHAPIHKRSVDFERVKDSRSASGGHGGRGAFSFYFSPGNSGSNKPASPGTTPVIVEPVQTDNMMKRASQIVHRSGFINRLANFSVTGLPHLSSNRNWKPYKVILKGSKLYFYKPPSDRAAAVKELFPTCLVAVLEEALEEEDENPAGDKFAAPEEPRRDRDRDDSRRKRTFWGRGTHPDLVISSDGKVEKGTLEALTHEAVFGTRFSPAASQSNEPPRTDPSSSDIDTERAYRLFASSVLLALPLAVDRARFETEFIRCASFLVSGAESEPDTEGEQQTSQRELMRRHVKWLTAKYLTYHRGSAPVDKASWDAFVGEVIPKFSPSDASCESGGMSDTNGLDTDAGSLPTTFLTMTDKSPDMDTFSPRPDDKEHMPSLGSAINLQKRNSAPGLSTRHGLGFGSPPSTSKPSIPKSRILIALEHEGLTREIFVRLETDLLARSLLAFHEQVLQEADLDAAVTTELLFGAGNSPPLLEYFGSDEHPHLLTQTVILHVLGPGATVLNGSHVRDGSANTSIDDRHSMQQDHRASSRTHGRTEAITKWIRVGEACRVAGAECAWRAIASALCSKPIARLEKAWKRVDNSSVSAVRTWVYPAPGVPTITKEPGDCCGVEGPKRTPWCGSARQSAAKLRSCWKEGGATSWRVEEFEEARKLFEKVHASLVQCRQGVGGEGQFGIGEHDEEGKCLVQAWKKMAGQSSRIHSIDQYMSMSFAAEPKRKGRFAPHFWTRHPNAQGLQALLPLAFPEPLPNLAMVDRSQIVRSKKISTDTNVSYANAYSAAQAEFNSYLDFSNALNPNGMLNSKTEGMILPVFDGELLLYVTSNPEPSPSRPMNSAEHPDAAPSRAPSIRVKSAAAGLNRKSSRARRASLPSLSRPVSAANTVADQPLEHPFRGVVKAGTLDALVHLLIHGLEGLSVSVADDNGEMVLRDKKTRAVKVDRTEFANIWWSVFRSFVSPYVMFQLIRKDYLSALPSRNSVSADDLVQSIQSRHEAVVTLAEWIASGGGAQDILDDLELYAEMRAFLENPSERDTLQPAPESDELASIWKTFQIDRFSLLQSFLSQTMRPQIRHVPVRGASLNNVVHNYGVIAPKVDEMTPEELVNNLDAMAAAAFRAVFQEDLFVTADLLEVQTADRTAWFSSHEPSSVSDDIEIQNLYTLITEIEPTSLIQEQNGDSLYRLLPPSVRSLVRAHTIIRKWLIFCLTTSQLGLKRRQVRMELFLRAIEVCRLRSMEPPPPPNVSIAEQPTMRSFVEGVLTSALVSRESRSYGRAWHHVASARGVSSDSLGSLLSRRTVESVDIHDRLTVDPAWLLEWILEVISLPDVIDSASDPPLSLVHYDKRRRLCNVINNASAFASRGTRQRREMDRCDFERLNRIEQEVNAQKIDLRSLREDAMRESMSGSYSATPSKRAYRPFQKLVFSQQEKNKRDKYMRERLLKEKRLEQQRQERKEDSLNRAMDIRGHASGAHANKHRSKRSMSALFSLMRPISTAFSSDSYSVSHRRSAAELDFTPANKPALVLSLVDARVVAFINNERSFTFQLDTEDGGHYLLQATSKAEMNQWMSIISSTVKSHAQRRLTYLGDPSQLQMPDHLQTRLSPQSEDPNAVFGVDLDTLLHRESDTGEIIPNTVPRVLDVCLTEIEKRGLTESGIYRVAGAQTEVNSMKEALGSGKLTIDRYADIHAVCGVVKYWFRVLPEAAIPESFFDPILDAARIPDLDERLAKIRDVVHSLPPAHYYVLKRFAEHLDRIVDYEEQNHMTPENLTTVICPNLLRAPNNNFGMIMANMAPIAVLFKALIVHVHTIFSEDEPDNEEEEEHEDPMSAQSDQGDNGVLGVGRTSSPELHSPQLELSPSPNAYA